MKLGINIGLVGRRWRGGATVPMIEGFMGYAGTTSNDSYGYATKGAMFQAMTNLSIKKIHTEFYAAGAVYEVFVALISGYESGVDTITSVVGRQSGLVAATGFAEIVLDTPAEVPAGAKFLVGLTRTDSTATAHASSKRHSGDYTDQEFAIQAPVTNHGVRIQDTSIQGGETIGGNTSISAKITFTADYAELTEDNFGFPDGTTNIDFTGYATKGSLFEAITGFQISKIHAAIGSPGDAYEAFVATVSGFTNADTFTEILTRETGLVAIDGVADITLSQPCHIPAGTKFAVALTRTDGGPSGFLNLKKTNGSYAAKPYAHVTASNPGFQIGDDAITGGEALSDTRTMPYKITFSAKY